MDEGTWTFRCRSCDSAFELSLTERQHAGDCAKNEGCPNCGSVPSAASPAEAMRRHKVIGYRQYKKTTRPLVF